MAAKPAGSCRFQVSGLNFESLLEDSGQIILVVHTVEGSENSGQPPFGCTNCVDNGISTTYSINWLAGFQPSTVSPPKDAFLCNHKAFA